MLHLTMAEMMRPVDRPGRHLAERFLPWAGHDDPRPVSFLPDPSQPRQTL